MSCYGGSCYTGTKAKKAAPKKDTGKDIMNKSAEIVDVLFGTKKNLTVKQQNRKKKVEAFLKKELSALANCDDDSSSGSSFDFSDGSSDSSSDSSDNSCDCSDCNPCSCSDCNDSNDSNDDDESFSDYGFMFQNGRVMPKSKSSTMVCKDGVCYMPKKTTTAAKKTVAKKPTTKSTTKTTRKSK